MMKEEAIAVTVSIDRIGQRVYLQIPLPANTHRIIGFEWGAMNCRGLRTTTIGLRHFNYFFDVMASKVIGRITLWTASPANIFLQDEFFEDRNIQIGENITGDVIETLVNVHGRKQEPVSCVVEDPPPFVEGYYQDSWGQGEASSFPYLLHLYLWIEKKCV